MLALAVLLSPALASPVFAETAKPGAAAKAEKKSSKKPPAKKAQEKPAKKEAGKKDAGKKTAAGKKAGGKEVAAKDPTPGPLADFKGVQASDDVVHVANYVSYTRTNFKRYFVLIDKKAARMYVFDPAGKLKGHSPVLLGKAVGDHIVPGIGNKPFKDIKEEEMTTPAGRFFARPGKNNHGESIIWIDYDAAVSMHRMRTVSADQRRAERMATEGAEDNRISYGCVNVPAKFYDTVLSPAARKPGAIIYVLPETKSPQQFWGTYDVAAKAKAMAKG